MNWDCRPYLQKKDKIVYWWPFPCVVDILLATFFSFVREFVAFKDYLGYQTKWDKHSRIYLDIWMLGTSLPDAILQNNIFVYRLFWLLLYCKCCVYICAIFFFNEIVIYFFWKALFKLVTGTWVQRSELKFCFSVNFLKRCYGFIAPNLYRIDFFSLYVMFISSVHVV